MEPTKHRKHGGHIWRARSRNRHLKSQPDADTTAKVKAFLQHLKSLGFTNSAYLQIVKFGSSGFGLRTTHKALKRGECFLQMPLSCVILPSQICKKEPQIYCDLSDELILIFYLYNQRLKVDRGETAEWQTYIRLIPQTYDLPALLEDDSEPIDAVPSSFYDQLRNVQKNFASVAQILQNHIAEKELNIQIDSELLQWAHCVVNTRSTDTGLNEDSPIQDSSALVPFWDLLNHSPYSHTAFNLNKIDKAFTCTVMQPCKKWNQVYYCYGHKSNREMYLYYGFIFIPPVPRALLNNSSDVLIFPSPHDVFTLCREHLKAALGSVDPNRQYVSQLARKVLTRHSQLMALKEERHIARNEYYFVTWPKLLVKSPKYIVSFQKNNKIAILTLSGQPVPEEFKQKLAQSAVIDINLAIFLAVCAQAEVASVNQATLAAIEYYRKKTLHEDLSKGELFDYYQIYLIVIDYLLAREFPHRHAGDASDAQQKILQYSEHASELDASLREMFLNELAMLLYLKQFLSDKLTQLTEAMSVEEKALVSR